MVAHAIRIFTEPADATGPMRHRWACSCGRGGVWKLTARQARTGGVRHVAAMERGR